jgi:hypothetical protein
LGSPAGPGEPAGAELPEGWAAGLAGGPVPRHRRRRRAGRTAEAIRRCGCVVVQGTFPRQRAECWDAALASYAERNRFAETYRAVDDGVFGGLAAGKPPIYPIYWSKPQIEARQDDNMVAVRRFLNAFWKHESQGRVWFDPDQDTAYPDRVRCRHHAAPDDRHRPAQRRRPH